MSHFEGAIEHKAFSLVALLDIEDDFNNEKPEAAINVLERVHFQQPIIRFRQQGPPLSPILLNLA